MSDIHKVLEERGKCYGEFKEHARITQELKRVFKRSSKWDTLSNPQLEALEMIAHKIGRILNGDPNYIDSWVDIVGYTQLVVDILRKSEEQKECMARQPLTKNEAKMLYERILTERYV